VSHSLGVAEKRNTTISPELLGLFYNSAFVFTTNEHDSEELNLESGGNVYVYNAIWVKRWECCCKRNDVWVVEINRSSEAEPRR